MIEIDGLTKRYGPVTALDGLTLQARPGEVTGFLGPNGAGKTTTLRALLGLLTPDSGTALIEGLPYARLPDPARTVGAALDGGGVHPGHTAATALRVVCRSAGIPTTVVPAALDRVGLGGAARRRVGTFSLGMRQRLNLACALVGDPRVVVLDEPSNGLDPAGLRWLRGLLRELADEGRTVLLSSHLLSEIEPVLDAVAVVRDGRCLLDGPLHALLDAAPPTVLLRTDDPRRLRASLAAHGLHAEPDGPDLLAVRAPSPEQAVRLAEGSGHTVSVAGTRRATLEHLFLDPTAPETSR